MTNKYQEAKDYAIGLIESNCYYVAPEVINAIDKDLQELIDKETPKKVITDGSIYSGTCDKVEYICPSCNQIMLRQVCITKHKPNYCYKCGQKLDWSDYE